MKEKKLHDVFLQSKMLRQRNLKKKNLLHFMLINIQQQICHYIIVYFRKNVNSLWAMTEHFQWESFLVSKFSLAILPPCAAESQKIFSLSHYHSLLQVSLYLSAEAFLLLLVIFNYVNLLGM